jgi:hypothetical protein
VRHIFKKTIMGNTKGGAMGTGNTDMTLTGERQLGESLSKRLAAYALAATATAGIGLTAGPAPAEASIISHTASLTVSCTRVHTDDIFSCQSHATLNIVGAIDLTFRVAGNSVSTGGFERHLTLDVVGKGAGIAVSSSRAFSFRGAARFGNGHPIGPAEGFMPPGSGTAAMARIFPIIPNAVGNWLSGRGYLGFEFSSHGEHFGWVAGSVSNRGSGATFRLDVTGYAYDTVAGQNILAGQTTAVPEPGTLVLLALGALGLTGLRKRKLSAVSDQRPANN